MDAMVRKLSKRVPFTFVTRQGLQFMVSTARSSNREMNAL